MRGGVFKVVKRGIDIIASVGGLVFLAPLFLLVALSIKLSSRGPIFYGQLRVGRNGETFRLLKFRTMHESDALTTLETARDDSRIFPLGRVLREFHVDELPQLWNVLIGEMSLIGPRPTVREHVLRYTSRQQRRLSVRPGLTGLAQVSGNNALTWPERIELDLEYVERASLLLDLRILLKTIRTVATRKGVYGEDGRVRDFDGEPMR